MDTANKVPCMKKYVIVLDITSEMKNIKPNMNAKLSCFNCLAVSDLI